MGIRCMFSGQVSSNWIRNQKRFAEQTRAETVFLNGGPTCIITKAKGSAGRSGNLLPGWKRERSGPERGRRGRARDPELNIENIPAFSLYEQNF
jgi:hypothetical protein